MDLPPIKTAADWVDLSWAEDGPNPKLRKRSKYQLRFPNTDTDPAEITPGNPDGYLRKDYLFFLKIQQGKAFAKAYGNAGTIITTFFSLLQASTRHTSATS